MSDQKRPYRKTRRAELEEQTRTRITESAVALHQELGPARTSISAVAEHAGVRRSTVYRHFPDDEALFDACSSHWRAANPPPDLHAWSAIEEPAERTRAALRALYAFYGRTEAMYASLMRDELLVPVVHRKLGEFYGYLRAIQSALMAGARTPWAPGAPDARGDRPRAVVPDVAVAHARARAERRGCRRSDVRARRRRRRGLTIARPVPSLTTLLGE